MESHLIQFDQINWVCPAAGIRYKAYVHGNQRVRLLEFSEGFEEPDWCLRGHAGYILEGGISIDFNGKTEHYKKGDTLFIPGGEADKHKATLQEGEKVLLLVFELV